MPKSYARPVTIRPANRFYYCGLPSHIHSTKSESGINAIMDAPGRSLLFTPHIPHRP